MNDNGKDLMKVYRENQYLDEIVQFEQGEVYIDCGMYDGDTVRAFARKVPDYKSIIGFEPDKKNISKWNDRSKYHDVRIINKGVWSEKAKLSFSEGGTASRITTEGDDTIEVTTIDAEIGKEEKVTYIKMDIEGSELEALKGAKETISRCMPKLAICVYHKQEDLITIPQYLRNFQYGDRKYQFYLRHHSLSPDELVLYAIPNREC